MNKPEDCKEKTDELEALLRKKSSELAILTAELDQAHQHLAMFYRVRDNFLSMLSHELRSPLAPLRAHIDLLKMRKDSSLKVSIEVMERSVSQETRLIDDLLDMARISTGAIPLQKKPMDFGQCLQSAIDKALHGADAKGQKLTLDIQANLPPLLGDFSRLQQLLGNLLDNAIEFSPQGGAVAIASRQENEKVVVRITDSGPGIDQAFFPHLYEPFHQADSSSRRLHGGLGLGLAISQNLARLHGGEIRAENLAGKRGACFTFSFPLQRASLPTALSPSSLMGRLRILLVDDSADTVRALTRLLSSRGLEVLPAESAEQALQRARESLPDVVVTDIGMPGQDGFDLLNALRKDDRFRNVPVIAATGYMSGADLGVMEEKGFAATLSKPVNLDELLATIGRLCRRGPAFQESKKEMPSTFHQ